MKEIRPCDKRSKRLHTGPYIYLFHIMLTNLLCQGKMLYVCCVSTGEISTTLIQRQTKHIQKVIFLLQSVIRVIHTPNAKLPFMFRCYVWYFCYGLILTIYHESIWSQIFVSTKTETTSDKHITAGCVCTCRHPYSLPK